MSADESAGRTDMTDEVEDRTDQSMAVFRRLLVNTLVTGVSSTFLWFSLTFWVYLETRSVVLTGVIGAAFSLTSAFLGPYFGTYVDRHRKHAALLHMVELSAVAFSVATVVFYAVAEDDLLQLRNPLFWVLVAATLVGAVAGQLRGIALSTCVTLLVPEDRRDRANGMVGTVTGVSFALTSVFSGLVIGQLGMGWAFWITLGLTLLALFQLRAIPIDEPEPDPAQAPTSHIDIRGALDAIHAVPGLMLLIGLAAFNNLLVGVFMALMDAYGLSLVSVETWGLLWGFISLFFIAGGLAVARFGLGSDPLRVVLVGNGLNWIACSLLAVRPNVLLLTAGCVVWLALAPVIEAAEQTVLQRAIPFERQGRVFGFAQMVENAAAPLTAFLMAPLAETVFMPFMTDGRGVEWIGEWFGTGPERGIGLMFSLAGLLGIAVTLLVWSSRSYRRLSASWRAAPAA